MKQLTRKAYEKLVATRDELEKKQRETVSKIERAKELGDLSENTEYITARQELNMLMAEIDTIENILRNCEIIEPETHSDCISLGSTVMVEYNGTQRQFTLVSFNEADPVAGKISNESPLGKALMNRCVGEVVDIETPAGKAKCKIKKIL